MKKISLALSILFIALAGCSSTGRRDEPIDDSDVGNFSFDRTNYVYKDGYTASDVQGSPWINGNIQEYINKVEKPSIKDDFYLSVNYDDLEAGNLGMFDRSSYKVQENYYSIFDSEEDFTDRNIIDYATSNVVNGITSQIRNYFDNLDVDTYLSSKEAFLSSCAPLYLNYFDNNEVELRYGDGLDIVGLNTLWFYGSYDSYKSFKTSGQKIMNYLLGDLGYTDASKMINTSFSFESALSTYSYSQQYYGERYHTYVVGELENARLISALVDMGLTEESVIYISEAQKYCIDTFYSSDNDTIKSLLITRLAFDYRFMFGLTNYLPVGKELNTYSSLFDYDRDLTDLTIHNATTVLARGLFPTLIEKAYINLFTSKDIRREIANTIVEVINEYKSFANSISWISEQTREGFKDKLNAMKYTSCYSGKIANYPAVDYTISEVSDTLLSIFTYYQDYLYSIKKEHKFAEELSAAYPCYTVNAFYSNQYNQFIILQGMIQDESWTEGYELNSKELIYGALGVVIGHEITHGFDNNGSYYDSTGRRRDWWAAKDRMEYSNRITKLKDFFDQIHLFDNKTVDGAIVNTEATADIGGMTIMLRLAKKIKKFNYDKFFKKYAKMWCELYDSYTVARMETNEHPYSYLRVNTVVSQFDEFRKTYNVKPGDGMYVPVKDRIVVL